jgi:hypothetical protein
VAPGGPEGAAGVVGAPAAASMTPAASGTPSSLDFEAGEAGAFTLLQSCNHTLALQPSRILACV